MSEFAKIPGYKINKILGKGGMGVVYLAIQESLAREVALKVTLPSLAEVDKSFTKRFVIEAKATAALNHPNIITIFDAGTHESSSYMAMEYIPNGTLKDLKINNFTHEDVCQLFIGIARGLDSAHSSGFVHRDIKPDNILISDNGTPVLTDFGIVKTLNQDAALTVIGSNIGTPKYMSPEQIQAHNVDGRSDLYSLGIMLFNLLEGKVPFDDDTHSAIYIMHVTVEPPALSKANEIFQPLISKLLEKTPDDRFSNAKEVIISLKQIIRNGTKQSKEFITKPIDLDKTKLNKPLEIDKTAVNKPVESNALKPQKHVGNSFIDKFLKDPKLLIGSLMAVMLPIVIGGVYLINKKQNKSELITQKETLVIKPENSAVKQVDNSELNVVPNPVIKNEIDVDKITQNDKVLNGSIDVVEIINKKDTGEIIDDIAPDKITVSEQEKLVIATKDTSQDKSLDEDIPANKIDETNIDIVSDSQTTLKDVSSNLTEDSVVNASKIEKIESEKASQNNTNEDEVNNLLKLAKTDIEKFRLLKPEDGNAYAKLNKVLDIDPQNQQAKIYILEIAEKYLNLANKKANKNSYADAIKYVNNAILVRKEYLARGYDIVDFLGVSDSIAIEKLNNKKLKLITAQKSYVVEQEQLKQDKKKQLALQEQERIKLAQQQIKARELSDVDQYNKGKQAFKSKNYKQAFEWFMKSALKNYAPAQHKIGSMYFSGKGVSQDKTIASQWITKAANQNYPVAQNHLGMLYFKGLGVRKNLKKAYQWLKKSAENNNDDAQLMLGIMYESGLGVRKNHNKSRTWFRKSARQGNQKAIEKLK